MDLLLMNGRFAAAGRTRWLAPALMAFVLVAGTLFPRLMLLGGLPSTDEGFYAYQAQLIHHSLSTGHGLPDIGTLALYPMLWSWVFGLGTNPMILLRVADLVAALVMAALLFRVLQRESGSRAAAALLTLVFTFTMNQTLFIQCGFKNSITAAFVPLLLALHLGQQAPSGATRVWITAGALTALAVLLRETFLPFVLLGLLAVLVARGWRAALRFALGGAVAALFLVSIVLLARGGVTEVIEAYRSAGVMYASIADQRVSLFLNNGRVSVQAAGVALVLAVLAMGGLTAIFVQRRRSVDLGRWAFWLSAALLPLIEPASKIGFPYHFAACLPGLAGLCAHAWKEGTTQWPQHARLMRGGLLIALVPLALHSFALLQAWPETREALDAAGSGQWPATATNRTNYLLAADAIRNVAPPGATLSVSGFMFTLYPLTGLLPPSDALSNLSATLIKHDFDGERFKAALRACPPDVLMTTTRKEWPGADTLKRAVEESGLYQQVASVPVVTDKAYGSFGGEIYRRTHDVRCSTNATP